ncbi:TonB-dependent receptor [Aestuariicella hydrocarbonica]|uniref:TonB-dependent receptor n=1 Tax=Pseudomaricurvus hydrocarbonicus TaxID=1470433 RepID=A0A9E5MNW3_9GAMM|nr:TonB-dependent receptor [Aestuariicella hydrocarbonica]NHO67643.1 TonB-dependent receptor [Aestuariicella hydrocarbonica]
MNNANLFYRNFYPNKMAAAVSLAMGVSAAVTAPLTLAAQAIEEVIVTVERREQSLQDVAATVQSFNAEELDMFGVNNDFRNLQNAVTGLHISNQEGKLEVYLRGVGNSDSDFASDPSVAIHYNDVYLPRPRSIGPMFFDVQRVEVNKGPQGTLRGRNATGGTINVISNKPEFDDTYGHVKVGLGSYEQRQLEGVLNLPVSDTLALRAAVYSEERDSYMDNAFTGSADELSGLAGSADRIEEAFAGGIDAPGAIDEQAIRLSAQWNPTDKFSAYFLADKVKQQGSGTPGAFTGRALSAGYDIEDLNDPYEQYFLNEGELNNDIEGFSTKLTYDFDGFAVEYNGSWREYSFQNRNAAREWQIGMVYPGSRDEANDVVLGNEQTAMGNFTQNEISETLVNEIRLYSTGDGPLQWTTGLFMMDEEFSNSSQDFNHGWWGDCDWYQDGTNCGWLNGLSAETRNNDSTVESRAVFFDGSYAFNESLRVKAGVRWTKDKKVAHESNVAYQLVVSDEALAALGLSGPEDIVMGSNGLGLTEAGDRPSDVIPIGNDDATRQYFLDGISSWGGKDNLDDLIAYDPSQFQVITSSIYDDGTGTGNITKDYEEEYADWRLGFEYDLAEASLLYGTVSTGTRSGGVNSPLPGALGETITWDPEKLTVWEVGSKNEFEWLEMPVRFNSALFYYDYQDKVVQGLVAVSTSCSSSITGICTDNYVQNQNAAKASLMGLELEGDILLPMDFRFRWNFAYLDSEFKDSEIVDYRQGSALVNVEGNQLPNTSKYNLTLTLAQALDVDWGIISGVDWSVSMTYRSKFYLTPFNDTGYDANGNEIPLRDMAANTNWLITGAGYEEANGEFLSDDVPATTIWNLNAGMNFGDEGKYRLEGWVSNLTEETYSGKGFINSDVNIRFLNPPRMGGVRFIAHF